MRFFSWAGCSENRVFALDAFSFAATFTAMAHRYFVLHKPYGTTSQFVSPHAGNLLGDINFTFPEGIHAIGRLDKYSEGLLLLTTNKKITALLFQGPAPHARTYLVQVKNTVGGEALYRLQTGVAIRIKGGVQYTTPPCNVQLSEAPTAYPLPTVIAPQQATTWLLITLTEGKYHQVRKMVGAVHHRCLRLIRISIEDMQLGDLQPGEVREVDEVEFFSLLKLDATSINAAAGNEAWSSVE